ncbi:MAG: hypothetical protein K0S08_620 [Gammaproteobacteria bacterium]|nr:hypothetical protein [Gammaproteobacteria bacterium]
MPSPEQKYFELNFNQYEALIEQYISEKHPDLLKLSAEYIPNAKTLTLQEKLQLFYIIVTSVTLKPSEDIQQPNPLLANFITFIKEQIEADHHAELTEFLIQNFESIIPPSIIFHASWRNFLTSALQIYHELLKANATGELIAFFDQVLYKRGQALAIRIFSSGDIEEVRSFCCLLEELLKHIHVERIMGLFEDNASRDLTPLAIIAQHQKNDACKMLLLGLFKKLSEKGIEPGRIQALFLIGPRSALDKSFLEKFIKSPQLLYSMLENDFYPHKEYYLLFNDADQKDDEYKMLLLKALNRICEKGTDPRRIHALFFYDSHVSFYKNLFDTFIKNPNLLSSMLENDFFPNGKYYSLFMTYYQRDDEYKMLLLQTLKQLCEKGIEPKKIQALFLSSPQSSSADRHLFDSFIKNHDLLCSMLENDFFPHKKYYALFIAFDHEDDDCKILLLKTFRRLCEKKIFPNVNYFQGWFNNPSPDSGEFYFESYSKSSRLLYNMLENDLFPRRMYDSLKDKKESLCEYIFQLPLDEQRYALKNATCQNHPLGRVFFLQRGLSMPSLESGILKKLNERKKQLDSLPGFFRPPVIASHQPAPPPGRDPEPDPRSHDLAL